MPGAQRQDAVRQAINTVEAARKAARISIRSAAKQAEITEGWWRAVVRGFLPQRGGGSTPAVPSVATLMRMAKAVRTEESVAALLGEPVPASEPTDENPYTDTVERKIWAITELSESEREHYIALRRAFVQVQRERQERPDAPRRTG